jgi:hypothetical protein
MMLKRIKKFKLETINKAWIIDDRERKIHEIKDQAKRHDDRLFVEAGCPDGNPDPTGFGAGQRDLIHS